jgi:hypothetical protein
MFGNTRTIAEAIAAGLSGRFEVTLAEIAEAPHRLPADVALLVVGGPTHAFGLSRRSTRRDAGKQAGGPSGLVSQGLGLREWLDDLDPHPGVPAATFDTHIDKPFPGSAAQAAKRRLRARGFQVLAAESFHVADTRGPLTDGEEPRARTWATDLATELDRQAGRRTG